MTTAETFGRYFLGTVVVVGLFLLIQAGTISSDAAIGIVTAIIGGLVLRQATATHELVNGQSQIIQAAARAAGVVAGAGGEQPPAVPVDPIGPPLPPDPGAPGA